MILLLLMISKTNPACSVRVDMSAVATKDCAKCQKCVNIPLLAVCYTKGKFAGFSYCPQCHQLIAGWDNLNAVSSLTCSEVWYAAQLATLAVSAPAPPPLVRSAAAPSAVLAASAAAVPVSDPPKTGP